MSFNPTKELCEPWSICNMTWQLNTTHLTFSEILNGFSNPSVKRSSISRTLKGQATLPVFHLPMVKCGRCYGVDKIFPQRAVQDHLLIRNTLINQHTHTHFWCLISAWLWHADDVWGCFTCLSRSLSPLMRNWELLGAGMGASSGGKRRQTPTLLRAPPSWANQPPLESSRVITTAFTRTM